MATMLGRRVEIPPHLSEWMMGDRFGVIVGQSADYYRVRLDRSRKVRRIATDVLEDFGRFV